MTASQILKLKPCFNFNGITQYEWFVIYSGTTFFSIRSGLVHADGKTKSPYHYNDMQIGKNAKKKALENFNTWYNSKLIQNEIKNNS